MHGKTKIFLKHLHSLSYLILKEKHLNQKKTEVDEGYFNPKHWNVGSPLLVKTYALDWLDIINVSPNTIRDYHSSVKNYITPFFSEKDIRNKSTPISRTLIYPS